MAFYIWGNEATLLGVLGIFTVLGGSLLYTVVKMRENGVIMPQIQKPVVGNGGVDVEAVETNKPDPA